MNPAHTTHPRQQVNHLALAIVCAVSVGCGLIVSACDSQVIATYQPPFVPIEITISSNGTVSVVLNASLTTPVGTFSAGDEVERNIQAPVHGFVLWVRSLFGNTPMDTGFKCNEDTPTKLVTIDSDIVEEIKGQLIYIVAKHDHTILISSPNSTPTPVTPTITETPPGSASPTAIQTPTLAPTPTPPPTPLLSVILGPAAAPECGPDAFSSLVVANAGLADLTWTSSTSDGTYWLSPSGGTVSILGSELVCVQGPMPSSPSYVLDVTITSNGGDQTLTVAGLASIFAMG